MATTPVDESELIKAEFPDRYINSAGVAHRIVSQAVSSHQSYWRIIRDCEDHIGGKKPKDPVKLKKANLGWSSNYNFGKARAKIEQGSIENVGEMTRSLALACVEFRRPDEDDKDTPVLQFLEDRVLREFVAAHVCNAFIETLFNDPRWSSHLTKLEYHAYAYGSAAIANEGNHDYLGNALHPLSIAFEDRSRIDDIRTWVIFDVIKSDKLWRVWNKLKDTQPTKILKGADGENQTFHGNWVMEGLQEIIWRNYQSEVTDSSGKSRSVESWEEVFAEYIKDPQAAIANTKNVKLAKIWIRELNGDYTETYVHYTPNLTGSAQSPSTASPPSNTGRSVNASKPDAPAVVDHILYQKNWGKIRSVEKMNIIRDSGIAPNGYIHELRGIARFAVEDSIRYNRAKNSLQDKLLFAGSPMIIQPNTKAGAKFEIGVHQGFSLLPAGFTFPANAPRADLQPHILAMQLDEQDYNRETLQFDSKVIGRLSSRPTKDEVQQVGSDAARSVDAKLSIKLGDYSTLAKAMLKRITEMVPREDTAASDAQELFFSELRWNLKEILQTKTKEDQNKEIKAIVKTVRSVVMDRVVRDVQAIQLSLQTAESPYEMRRLERMLLLALGHSYREVNRLKPPLFESQSSYQDERVAAIENDMFWRTGEIVYRTTDNPVTHLDMHMSKLNRVFERVREGQLDPVEAFNYGTNSIRHQARHLEKMEQSTFYKKFHKRYSENFKFMLSQLEEIKRIAQELAKRQQQQQQNGGDAAQPTPEELAKIRILEWEALKKQERTEFLTQHRNEQDKMRFERDQERKDAEHSAKMQRDTDSATLKNRIKVLEAANDALINNRTNAE